jgi:hypothetical protein
MMVIHVNIGKSTTAEMAKPFDTLDQNLPTLKKIAASAEKEKVGLNKLSTAIFILSIKYN